MFNNIAAFNMFKHKKLTCINVDRCSDSGTTAAKVLV